jgi:hypothetical protein
MVTRRSALSIASFLLACVLVARNLVFVPYLTELLPTVSWEQTSSADAEDSFLLVPEWFHTYVEWHAQQIAQLNETNWATHRYLVLRCLHKDIRCGGTADRIKSIPFAIKLASTYNRILLIHWERPARLEEFLVPVRLNWTVPSFCKFEYGDKPTIAKHRHFVEPLNSSTTLVDMRHQRYDLAVQYYNTHKENSEPSFDEIYKAIWSTVFTPSPGVAAVLLHQTVALGLTPGHYVALHVRSQYLHDKSLHDSLAHNAARCASGLGKGMVFVATDSDLMTSAVVEYGNQHGGSFVARPPSDAPLLHMDTGTNFLSREHRNTQDFAPSAFYSIFVDLYLIAQSTCVAYTVGHFGSWGSLLSRNRSCALHYETVRCNWTNASEALP